MAEQTGQNKSGNVLQRFQCRNSMSFFSSVSFFSNRALCTSCCCTEIQWWLASDDDNEKNKQTNKRCAPISFLEETVAVAWNDRRGRHHVSFFFHTGARWRQICILIDLSFPSFFPASSQRTWPSLRMSVAQTGARSIL